MKNDPNGLDEILSGKLVLYKRDLYITADINNPAEFILIDFPTNPDAMLFFGLLYSGKNQQVVVPGDNDIPVYATCLIADNKFFGKQDFTWVKRAECWAYYPKI